MFWGVVFLLLFIHMLNLSSDFLAKYLIENLVKRRANKVACMLRSAFRGRLQKDLLHTFDLCFRLFSIKFPGILWHKNNGKVKERL